MRLWLISLVTLAACRPAGLGTDERTTALLADYRARTPLTFPAAEGSRPWALGQFTVHAVTAPSGAVALERIAIVGTTAGGHWLSLERLGTGGEALRIKARRSEQAIDEAWVKAGEQPEVHHLGAVPRDVTERFELALGALEGPSGTLTTPAGTFEGCRAGRHGAVPLSGVVRAPRRDGARVELLELGDDGSGSLF